MAKYLDSVGLSRAFELIKYSISGKQDALVSGTNIKTINNTSLLGSGNITVGGGGGGLSFDDVYPVGSIYMSVSSTDPGTLFGGTWVRLTDTFLLAAGSTYAADDGTHTTATGGSATHVHATKGHKLTTGETPVPAHAHPLANSSIVYNNASSNTQRMATSGSGTKISVNTNVGLDTYNNTAITNNTAHDHGNTDDGSSMPPYLPVYMWKRTA